MTQMRSALYEGVVRHRRLAPVRQEFTYRIVLPLIDLDELDAVCALHPWWARERMRPVTYRRRDFFGPAELALEEAVREKVAREFGQRPAGPIAMLAHPRIWGWQFNPISLYYCYDESGARVESLLAQVTNTPWHESHAYVLGAPGTHRVDKALHVSPFMGMNAHYDFSYDAPTSDLHLAVNAIEQGELVLETSLDLTRREITRGDLGRVLWDYPLMTARVSLGIYHQAARLRRSGVPFVAHPARGRAQGFPESSASSKGAPRA